MRRLIDYLGAFTFGLLVLARFVIVAGVFWHGWSVWGFWKALIIAPFWEIAIVVRAVWPFVVKGLGL